MSRFGIDSMMLVIALVAGCVAVMRESTAAGVTLAILFALAMPRTVLQIARNEAQKTSTFDKAIEFFVSTAIILVISLPALVALVLVTSLCMMLDLPWYVSLVAGIGSTVGVGYVTYRHVCRPLKP